MTKLTNLEQELHNFAYENIRAYDCLNENFTINDVVERDLNFLDPEHFVYYDHNIEEYVYDHESYEYYKSNICYERYKNIASIYNFTNCIDL